LSIDLLLIAVLASFAAGCVILLTAPWHRRWTADHAGSGVQKQHHGAPARVGLIPILVGCAAVLCLRAYRGEADALRLDVLLLLCAMPAALMGLLEDVTKKVRARWRLLAPALGTVAAIVWLNAVIPPLGVPVLDTLLSYWPIAVLATLLMVVGFTHAMNIVDGLNGLSSGLAMLMLLATAWAAHGAHDPFITQAALMLAAAILGFWLLNFPRGKMFLGDGGAYFLGFVLALLWVLLLVRNPGQISVWFVLALAVHPTVETIFSIARRRFLRARPRAATAPDRLHLHSLVFRRRARPLQTQAQRAERPWAMNAVASAGLLVYAAVPMAFASISPASHWWNLVVLAVGMGGYFYLFNHMTALKGRGAGRRSKPSPAKRQVVPSQLMRSGLGK
jgi:UDP-N-acetylmuramyl pentapeptide phosphotransferase/UDP-N-acetylglucosamine-1-phosphate transferase